MGSERKAPRLERANKDRAVAHQTITRPGVDVLADRIGSAKEDVHFRELELESFIPRYRTPEEVSVNAEVDGEAGTWFDWVFLEFWKSNHCNGMDI